MSYLVFARKWRPKKFSEVLGQEHITITLENAIKSDRLASAYLFSGPRGVGKTTTARILAKALNCENGPTANPCDNCTICNEVAQGNAIDVLEIDGASNRGIDEIRNLRESTRYTPAKSRNKIYIIDEVHMLTNEAFNALLKTLEEPPPHVIFIFATTELNKVPATILSRCQRFDFKRIANVTIVQQLKVICEHDAIKIDDNALHLIAKKADGSMRDSESLLDQVVSFCGMEVAERDVAELLGLVQQDLFIEIGNAIIEKRPDRILEISQRVYEHGLDANALMLGLNEYFNDVLKTKITGETTHLLGLEGYHAQYQSHANAFSEIDLIRSTQFVAEATGAMKRSLNPQLQMENTLLRLVQMSTSVQLDELLNGIEELKKKTIIAEMPKQHLQLIPEIDPQRVSGSLFARLSNVQQTAGREQASELNVDAPVPTVENDGSLTLNEIKAAWPAIVSKVKTQKIALGSFLQEGVPVQVRENTIDVIFKETNGYNIATLNEHRRFIQSAIESITGKKALLNCLSGENGADPGRESPNPKSQIPKLLAKEQRIESSDTLDTIVEITDKEVPVDDIQTKTEIKTENHSLEELPVAQKLVESLEGELIE